MNVAAESLQTLPLETRLLRYHEFAEEALRQAEQATVETVREELIVLARAWRDLALEAERVLRQAHQRPHDGGGPISPVRAP